MYLNPSEAEKIPKENVKDGLRRSERERLIQEARAGPGGERRMLSERVLQVKAWSARLVGKLRRAPKETRPEQAAESGAHGRLARGGPAGG